MNKKIPVLMYHALEDDDHPCGLEDPGELVYVLRVITFEEQMEFLHINGFQPVLSLNLVSAEALPDKPVVIGFDDGHVSNITLALPILKKYNFVAEFYVTTNWIGLPNYLSEDQLIALNNNGMVIGSHGSSHSYFNDLSRNKIVDELSSSKNILENLTGTEIDIFSAPGGRYNETTIDCLRRLKYRIAYTSEVGYYNNKKNQLTIPRFAIKRSIKLDEFQKIVQQSKIYYFKIKISSKILKFLKWVFGNKLYEQVRATLVR